MKIENCLIFTKDDSVFEVDGTDPFENNLVEPLSSFYSLLSEAAIVAKEDDKNCILVKAYLSDEGLNDFTLLWKEYVKTNIVDLTK